MKFRITISKYHSWYLCQIWLLIMLLPILIFQRWLHYGHSVKVMRWSVFELKRSANAAITASAIWYIWELFRKDKCSCLESEFTRELKQRRRQQGRRKTKEQICTCIMLLSMLLDYKVKFHSNAHVLWRAWTRDRNFLFFSWTYSPLEFSSRKIH